MLYYNIMKTKRKKIFTLFLAGGCLALLVSSCAGNEVIERNLRNLPKIRKGMTKAQVTAIMGEPVKGESYCSENVFYYYTHRAWMDGLITRDECTPVVFDYFGKVIGWGKDFHTGIYSLSKEEK